MGDHPRSFVLRSIVFPTTSGLPRKDVVVMSKSAMKYLSGVVALLLLSALAGVYLQGALRIFICAAVVLGMLYLVVKIVRGERAQ